MKATLCGLLVMTCLLSVALYAQEADQAQNKTEDISLADLKKAIADKAVVLLDCNGSQTYAKGHLPGAIDFEASEEKLATLLPADKGALIVAYCGSPRCLAYRGGVNAARKLGYTNIKHFSGGLSGWKEAGEPLEK